MTWEYVAGFFDGEGCIGYHKRAYGRYVYAFVSQGVVNERESSVLAEMQKFLRAHGVDASLTCETNAAHPQVWRLKTSAAISCDLWLKAMLPHLRVKQAKAREAIAFIGVQGIRAKTTAKMRDRIEVMHNDGWPMTHIASRVGVCVATVFRHVSRLPTYKRQRAAYKRSANRKSVADGTLATSQ